MAEIKNGKLVMKQKVEDAFKKVFNTEPTLIVRSPGRVDIIGVHTDYNDGFVSPAAIDKSAHLGVVSQIIFIPGEMKI